jgi:hypothetical protein
MITLKESPPNKKSLQHLTASVRCGFNRGLHGWLSLSLGR